MDMQQLEQLLEIAGLSDRSKVLDVGCGNGGIAEYISDATGCHVTGIDYIPEAVRQAQERTREKQDRLTFLCVDVRETDFPSGSFDMILSVDTIYIYEDLKEPVCQMRSWLTNEGQLLILYSFVAEENNDSHNVLLPENTPLGQALTQCNLSITSWDLTAQDYQHQQRKKRLAEEFRPLFEAEDLLFIYENRFAEGRDYSAALEAGRHCRYLYRATTKGEVE
jgi:cyclopropane fatty-acyl-phospholipid synthase-like methyltransferase